MKRLFSVVVLAFVVLAPCARADSILNINITYVTAFMAPTMARATTFLLL
jgi:uncharacterized lipoprotein YajG